MQSVALPNILCKNTISQEIIQKWNLKPHFKWGFLLFIFPKIDKLITMSTLSERIKVTIGFNYQEPKSEIVKKYKEPTIEIVSENETIITMVFPHKYIAIPGLTPFEVKKKFKHHGVSAIEEKTILLLTALAAKGIQKGVSKIIKREKEVSSSQNENGESTQVTRRTFLQLATKLAFLGTIASIPFIPKNPIGIVAQKGAILSGFDAIKSSLAHMDPLRAFIGGKLQPTDRQETHVYSTESLSINFNNSKKLHSETDYTLTSFPINWEQEGKPNATDYLQVFEPNGSDHFQLKLHSALAHQHKQQDAIGYQVGVMLNKLIKKSGQTAEYWSHNRYNDPLLGFSPEPENKVLTDPEGIPKPINYMHTGPMFLGFNPPNQNKPLFLTVPSWTSQPSMTWGGSLTSEKPLSLIEFSCLANEYACWSTDMLPKYKELNHEERIKFIQILVSKVKDHWGGVPVESIKDPAYSKTMTINTNGDISIKNNINLAKELLQLTIDNKIEQYLSENHILRPVSLIDLTRTEPILDRENDAANIAINFSVIKDNKCIGHITANQNRRVTMEQLKKIATLWLKSKGISTDNSYLVGMDEHGGGEVVNATNIT